MRRPHFHPHKELSEMPWHEFTKTWPNLYEETLKTLPEAQKSLEHIVSLESAAHHLRDGRHPFSPGRGTGHRALWKCRPARFSITGASQVHLEQMSRSSRKPVTKTSREGELTL